MNPYVLPAGNVQLAFSGGRTSAEVGRLLVDAKAALPHDYQRKAK